MRHNWTLINRLAAQIEQPRAGNRIETTEEEVRFALRQMQRNQWIVPVDVAWSDDDVVALSGAGANSPGDGYRYIDSGSGSGKRGGEATPLFKTFALTAAGRAAMRIGALPELDTNEPVNARMAEAIRLRAAMPS